MSTHPGEIHVWPGTLVDVTPGEAARVVITLTQIPGETLEEYAQRCDEIVNYAVRKAPRSGPSVVDVSDTTRYRKIGEGAYEMLTPGYQPAEDTPHPDRDTHFQLFAALLYNDLQANRAEALEHSWTSVDLDRRQCLSIARRAYDLIWHDHEYIAPVDLDSLTIAEQVARIPDITYSDRLQIQIRQALAAQVASRPDLTAWPKPHEE